MAGLPERRAGDRAGISDAQGRCQSVAGRLSGLCVRGDRGLMPKRVTTERGTGGMLGEFMKKMFTTEVTEITENNYAKNR